MKRKACQGQSTVELAFVLPILALLLFIIVQLGFAFNAYVTIVHTAREVAREAAISPTELSTGDGGEIKRRIKSYLTNGSPPLSGSLDDHSIYTGEKNKNRKIEIRYTYKFKTGFESSIIGIMEVAARLAGEEEFDPPDILDGIPLRASAVMAVQ